MIDIHKYYKQKLSGRSSRGFGWVSRNLERIYGGVLSLIDSKSSLKKYRIKIRGLGEGGEGGGDLKKKAK